jgi:hypothetical protein
VKTDLISSTERKALTGHLRDVHLGFSQTIDRFNDTAWTTERCAGEWSPAQVTEHALLVERSILQSVTKHLNDTPSPERQIEVQGKDELLRRFLLGQGRAKASEKSSTFLGLTKVEVVSSLAQSYYEFSAVMNVYAATPLHGISWRHGGFGLLTGFQWLLYIPLHSERHLHQLRGLTTPR